MKEPVLILIGLFIIVGIAYGPLKNAKINAVPYYGAPSYSYNSSSVGSPGTTEDGYSNKEIAQTIRNTAGQVKNLETNVDRAVEERSHSIYYGKVSLSSIAGLYQDNPDQEYIYLYTNLQIKETVDITGWFLKSAVTGYSATIGKAAVLPFPFTNTEANIVLQQGDRVYLTKGFSPIGISFRTNKCTGYFEENRTFTPSLPIMCPRPSDEDLPQFSPVFDRNDECVNIIERLPGCTTVSNSFLRDLPDTVSQSCKDYMKNQINYNTCVANHFSDIDFPGNEYRVYLKRFGPLWRPTHDKIFLYDTNGFIVSSVEY